MKKLLSFFFFFSFVLNVNFAQTALTTAVDFSLTDRFGEDHNLYEILDDGKYVLIDFFTYYCAPCCDIAPDINKLYYNFGCNQSEVYVISIEGAGDMTQLQTFEDACGGTSQKPVVTGVEGNGIEVSSNYGLGAYPTVILIAPDREIIDTDIWPFNYQIIKSRLQTLGISPSECETSFVTDNISGVSAIKLTPNPASTNTRIEFSLNESNHCNIELLNMTGQSVRNILSAKRPAGNNNIEMNTIDLAAGTYILKIETETSIPQITKLVISN